MLAIAEPQYEEVVPKPYKRKKQKGKRETDLADFPVVHIEHKLSDEECVCIDCGNYLKYLQQKKHLISALCRLILNEKNMRYPYMGVKTVAAGISFVP